MDHYQCRQCTYKTRQSYHFISHLIVNYNNPNATQLQRETDLFSRYPMGDLETAFRMAQCKAEGSVTDDVYSEESQP